MSSTPPSADAAYDAFFAQHREEYMDAFLKVYKEIMPEIEKHHEGIMKMKHDESVPVDPEAAVCMYPTAERMKNNTWYRLYKISVERLETCEDEELKEIYREQIRLHEETWHDYNKMNALARFQKVLSVLEKAVRGTGEKILEADTKLGELLKRERRVEERVEERKKRKIT